MSTTRPTNYNPQTLRAAKAEYKKHGPRLSSQEVRQISRGSELFQRAEKIKETERRRKINEKKRAEKEKRERDARRHMGVGNPAKAGLASRIMGIGEVGSQRTLGGLGFFKVKAEGGSIEDEGKLEVKEEPWEEEGLDDGSLLRLEVLDSPTKDSCQSGSGRQHLSPSHILSKKAPKDADNFEDEAQATRMALITNNVSPPFSKPVIKPTGSEEKMSLDFDLDFLVSNTQIERELSSTPIVITLCRSPSVVTTSAINDIATTPSASIPQPKFPKQDDRQKYPAPLLEKNPTLTRAAQDRILMPPPTFKTPNKLTLHSRPPSTLNTAEQPTNNPHSWKSTFVPLPMTHFKSDTGRSNIKASARPSTRHRHSSPRKEGHSFPAHHETDKENAAPVVLLREEDFDLSTQDCREIYG